MKECGMLEKNYMKKIVRQHNDYISAPYAVELTIHEIKLIEFMISESRDLDKKLINNNQNKEFVFTATELSNILNTSLSRIVTDADKLSENITQKRIIEKKIDESGNVIDFVYIPIITFAKYSKGLFTFSFNCYILRYFVDINQNFTEFELKHLMSMSSPYAIKLYKLLSQYKNIKNRSFTVDGLKEQFGIPNKYSQYSDFKKYVLDSSVAQIIAKTDLHVSYNEIKLGRRVVKLAFSMTLQDKLPPLELTNTTYDVIDVKLSKITQETHNQEINNLISNIESNLSVKTKKFIAKLHQQKGIEFIEASIKYATKNAKSNLDKYLYDTLTNEWAEVELQKILDKKTDEQKRLEAIQQKQKQEQQRKAELEEAKLTIQNTWNELSQKEQDQFTQQANTILTKHQKKLQIFQTIANDLPLCCYAISNNQSYDKAIEGFCTTILGVSFKST